jgi:hypothetical protein
MPSTRCGERESPLLIFPRPRERERVADLPGSSIAETEGRVRVVGIKTNPVERI